MGNYLNFVEHFSLVFFSSARCVYRAQHNRDNADTSQKNDQNIIMGILMWILTISKACGSKMNILARRYAIANEIQGI